MGRGRTGDKRGKTLRGVWAGSIQATPSQVVGDDDVGDGIEHHLDVSCIRGAGQVTVDFLVWGAILALELCLDVSCCVVVSIGSWREESEMEKIVWLRVIIQQNDAPLILQCR